MKKLFLLFVISFSVNLFSQNITNTLGTGGIFTIKDASTNYFTLTQSTGQVNIINTLRLENTTSATTGVIYKGTDRFLHNYKPASNDGNNTFLGINAGNFTMSGGLGFQASYNTGIGFNSLTSLTTGYVNTAVGYLSLLSNTTGSYNTALGNSSLSLNTTGYENTALGYRSLYSNTTGYNNTALGNSSLSSNTTGFSNTAVGYLSLSSNTSGIYNTAVGNSSLSSNTTGYRNIAVGYHSLYSNTTGYFNTALGYFAGNNVTTGINLTLIGYNAEPTSGSAINEITLGNSSVTALRCAVTTITALSDARDKKNIRDLSLGLDFITKLKPRQFNWDKRDWYDDNKSDGSKMQEAPTAGFIAQELDVVQTTSKAEWLNLVLKVNPDKLEATPGNLLPVMVKAIQELKEENDRLKEDIESLKSMKEEFARLEQLVVKLKANANNDNSVSLTGTN